MAIQVQIIESRWTDKAYNHGLAWRSHPLNQSMGGYLRQFVANRRRLLFIRYVWNAMCCLHTTVQGCYFASTSRLSTIYHSLYLSGTIDHCRIPSGISHALLHELFTRHLVLSCSIVYTACSNIYYINNTSHSISLHF